MGQPGFDRLFLWVLNRLFNVGHSEASVANPAVTEQVPCGSDFLIRGVQPGAYVLDVSVGRRETAAWGRAPVEVRGTNVEVPLTLESSRCARLPDSGQGG